MRLRRRVATILDEVSRISGRLADLIDPPVPPVTPQERQQSRLRHPSTAERPQTLLGTVAAEDDLPRPIAPVVPLRPEESP